MLFFGKKKDPISCRSCAQGGCCARIPDDGREGGDASRIKVLGGGCVKCHRLKENAELALKELGADLPVELITDFSVIAGYGVMSTPALVADEQVLSVGRVLSSDEVAALLKGRL